MTVALRPAIARCRSPCARRPPPRPVGAGCSANTATGRPTRATEGTGQVCFAMTKPDRGHADARRLHRRPISTSPTARPRASATRSTSSPASPSPPTPRPRVTVSGQSFDLFTQNDAAWLLDAEPERQSRQRHPRRLDRDHRRHHGQGHQGHADLFAVAAPPRPAAPSAAASRWLQAARSSVRDVGAGHSA